MSANYDDYKYFDNSFHEADEQAFEFLDAVASEDHYAGAFDLDHFDFEESGMNAFEESDFTSKKI